MHLSNTLSWRYRIEMHDHRESAICWGRSWFPGSPRHQRDKSAWDQRGCRAGFVTVTVYILYIYVYIDRKWLDFWDQCWTRCEVVKKNMRELPPSSCWSWFLLFDGHENSVQSSSFGRTHLRILLKPWQMMYFYQKNNRAPWVIQQKYTSNQFQTPFLDPFLHPVIS